MKSMAARRRIEALVEKWHERIADRNLEMSVKWNTKRSKYGKSGCFVNEAYFTVEYHFSIPRLRLEYPGKHDGELNWEAIEQEVVHECVHTLTWPICRKLESLGATKEAIQRYEEQLTTLVERAIWAVYREKPVVDQWESE